MLVLRPDYFEQFSCVAGDCLESCCINWKIDVDKLSFHKYREVKGEFGKYLNDRVVRDRKNGTDSDYAIIKLDENRRCSFLNDNNLCEIYINIGEKYLCNTCKQYPRYIYKYGDRYEITLTISCPEVARLILLREEPITFNMTEEEVPPANVKEQEYEEALHDILWDVRSLLIDIAQYRNIPTWKRMVFIKQVMDKVMQAVVDGTYSSNLLGVLISYVENEKSAAILEKAHTNRAGKRKLIESILQYRMDVGIDNINFNNRVEDVMTFFKNIDQLEQIDSLEMEYEEYIKEKDYILENYMVYYIYANLLTTLWTGDTIKEIDLLIFNYVSIKYMLFIEWLNKKKELQPEDFINVIYSFSRGMEHNFGYKDGIYEALKENDMTQIEDLVNLLA